MTTNMTYDEYMSYASEIGALERLLERTPEHRRIMRIGFQGRLDLVRQKIDGVPVPPRPKELAATFGGEPIIDSYGIDANFAADAVTFFSNTIRLTTAGLTGELLDTGQIPRSAMSQPIITGVALGSFGFVMELPQPLQGISYPEQAVSHVQELLRLAKEGEDDDLSLAAAEIHPRAVIKVTDLLDFMRRKQAYFSTRYQDNEVRFDSSAEIEDAARRLAPSNVGRETREIVGTLIGVVPDTRTFQLDTNDGESIHGRIGPEIRDAYLIGEQYTNQQVRAQIRTVRIGRGAPRHTLLSVFEIPDLEDD